MRSRNKLIRLFVILLSAVMLLSVCAASASSGKKDDQPKATEYALAMEAAQELADYLDEYRELPDNFIRKKEAALLRHLPDTYEIISFGTESRCGP